MGLLDFFSLGGGVGDLGGGVGLLGFLDLGGFFLISAIYLARAAESSRISCAFLIFTNASAAYSLPGFLSG